MSHHTHNRQGWKPNRRSRHTRAFLTPELKKNILLLGIAAVVLGSLFLLGFMAFISRDLPNPNSLTERTISQTTKIYDRTGEHLLYEIFGDENRTLKQIQEGFCGDDANIDFDPEGIPLYALQATIAAEDRHFCEHGGFDVKGLLRAVVQNFMGNRVGGSTLTQQLVKNAILSNEKTITRKIKELILSVELERRYSKDEILQIYFNEIPYGSTYYGLEAAAQNYYQKSVNELTLAEAATLAALPKAPSTYLNNPDRLLARRNYILTEMLDLEFISQEEHDAALLEETEVEVSLNNIDAPHFVLYVKEQLEETYGQREVEEGGFRVITTLDYDMQIIAEEEVATGVDTNGERYGFTNAALVAIDPNSGQILSMVGSKDYFSEDIDGKFNVTTALRQPGSAIKPLNYAVGLALKKVTPATIFADIPSCFSGGPELYCPKNYDGLFHGAVQVRYALGNSFNIPAVKMLALNGIETFIASASAMGLDSLGERDPSEFGLSLTLGGGEVKMTEMATAFGSLANLGVRKNLVSILKVEDRNGQVLEENQFENGERVLPMEAAYLVSQILLDNNARSAAFGSSSDLVVKDHPEVSVKTGTTNDKRDNWTVGYTPNLAVVVWVGNNDNSPMGYIASGVTGASPIWNKVMTKLLEGQKQEWPKKPVGIIGTSVCNLSGAAQPEEGCQLRYEFFIDGTVPPAQSSRKTVLVNRETGWVIQPGEPDDNAEWQEHEIITDPLGVMICLDCAPRDKPVTLRY